MKTTVEIGPNLEPAVQIGSGDWVTVTPAGGYRDGKPRWRITILRYGEPDYSDDSLSGWGNAGDMLESALSFLYACAESYGYRMHTGKTEVDPDSNEGLFPPEIAEWAYQNSDEISMAQCELEEEMRNQ